MSNTSFLATAAAIPQARDELETWLRTQVPQMAEIRLYEIVLAANELFFNVFDHGDAASGCFYDMRRVANQLILRVSNAAVNAQLLPAEWWTMPDVNDQRGRGLAIVKTVASDVALHVTPASVSITVTFDLHDKTPEEAALAAKLAL